MRGKRTMYALALGLLWALAGAQLSYGAGFALYEGSARGNSLGGTLVGRADDASALYYNPAGITQLPGAQIMAGATFIAPTTDVVARNGTFSTQDNVWIPPHFYATYQLNDRISVGLGSFSQFGLGTIFDDQAFTGRTLNRKAVIESMTINPNIAFKLNDQFSIAFGMDAVWFKMEYALVPLNIQALDTRLKGDSWGYGYNVALHYKPCQWASFGASYRSEVKQHLTGDSTSVLAAYNGSADASLMLPDMLFLGMTLYPMDRLSVELGGIWTRWSDFPALQAEVNGVTVINNRKNWSDVWRLQFGVEYKALDWLDLRVGYDWDQDPIQNGLEDLLIPANDRHLFSFGPGFHWRNWTLDLSYTYLLITGRDVQSQTLKALGVSSYENGHAHLLGASVSYKF